MNPTKFKALSIATAILFFASSILSWVSLCSNHPWSRVPDTNFTIKIFGQSSINETSPLSPIYFLLIEGGLMRTLLLMSAGIETAAFLMAVSHFLCHGRVRILWLQLSSVFGQISLTCQQVGIGLFAFYIKEKGHRFCYPFYLAIASCLLSILSIIVSQTATYIIGTNILRLFGDGFTEIRPKYLQRSGILKANLAVNPFAKVKKSSEEFSETHVPPLKYFPDEEAIQLNQLDNHSGTIKTDSLQSERSMDTPRSDIGNPILYDRMWFWRKCSAFH
ncbi:hypothetical protein ACOME3_010682 [Neoechinorhynchus agilis]